MQLRTKSLILKKELVLILFFIQKKITNDENMNNIKI